MEDKRVVVPASAKTQKIVSNTLYLYVRMFLILFINLFSVRLIIKALGMEDYGIYNAVAGVITLLNGVTAVLTSAIQRFYSFYLGRNELLKLRDVFSASIIIYAAFAIVVLVFGETFGLWIVTKKLIIPEVSRDMAMWLYQFTLLTFIVALFQVPFSAAVIAHEDMKFFSIISLIDCFLRFVVIFPLFCIDTNRLSVYGILLFIVSLYVFLCYFIKSKKNYEECRMQQIKDKSIFKDLLSYSGWTFYGSIAGTGMIQGNTLLVNIFFGPITSAARAISIHASSAVNLFSSSFITALRPPMIKSYAENNHEYLMKLFRMCNIIVYYLLLVVSVPLILEMDSVLNIWLDTKDYEAVLFSRLIVIYTVILSLHHPFTIVMQAIGKTKEYFVPVDTFTLLSLPATYILYNLGLPSEATYYTMIIAVVFAHAMRMQILKKHYRYFDVRNYIMTFVLPALFVTVVTVAFSLILHNILDDKLMRFIIVLLASMCLIVSLSLIISVKKEERAMIYSFIRKIRK